MSSVFLSLASTGNNVIALDSKYEPAWYGKAEAFARQRNHKEVIKCCDKAIALLPADAKARNADDNNYYFSSRWYIKANALSELGKHKEAIKCYDEALEMGSNRGQGGHVFGQKGITLAKLGKHEEAIKCYDKALEMVGRDEGYNVFAKKGITLASLGRHKESIKCYDEALKRMGYRTDSLRPKINLAKADALSELGEGVSDETSMFKCYSSAIRFYTDKLFDDKHQPVVDIDDWEEGARKLQEICSRAINGFEKYYHYDDEDN